MLIFLLKLITAVLIVALTSYFVKLRLCAPCVAFIITVLTIYGLQNHLFGYHRKPTFLPSTKLHYFRKAAVYADSKTCARIGRDILFRNGSAVDAAVATLFCNGIYNMQSMGLGGGFLMLIYFREQRKTLALNARETAPSQINQEMYKCNSGYTKKGPLAVGIPGELRGYWTVHQKFGKLPWSEIIKPSIELCERGYQMSRHQFKSLHFNYESLANDTNLKKWFLNEDGQLKRAGSVIYPEKLCDTLKIIASEGGDVLNSGSLSDVFLSDLKAKGSVIIKEDLVNYQPHWVDPIETTIDRNYHLHTFPPPGSGILLAFILHILNGYNFNFRSITGRKNTILTLHRMIETFKYAYAKRTELGDPKFANIKQVLADMTCYEYAKKIRSRINDFKTFDEPKHYGAFLPSKFDKGTAHISVLAENGDAVSVTSTINLFFGAAFTSENTGILLNSIIDDFSLPYYENYFGIPFSPNNKLEPNKQPLSSMAPSIVTDTNGDVKLVIGAAGGTKITTAIAQVLIRILWFEQNVQEAINEPRLHHQIFPMSLQCEKEFSKEYLTALEALGHNISEYKDNSVVSALHRKAQYIFSCIDMRRRGGVNGYD